MQSQVKVDGMKCIWLAGGKRKILTFSTQREPCWLLVVKGSAFSSARVSLPVCHNDTLCPQVLFTLFSFKNSALCHKPLSDPD